MDAPVLGIALALVSQFGNVVLIIPVFFMMLCCFEIIVQMELLGRNETNDRGIPACNLIHEPRNQILECSRDHAPEQTAELGHQVQTALIPNYFQQWCQIACHHDVEIQKQRSIISFDDTSVEHDDLWKLAIFPIGLGHMREIAGVAFDPGIKTFEIVRYANEGVIDLQMIADRTMEHVDIFVAIHRTPLYSDNAELLTRHALNFL